jgi:hypothetical protein
MCDSRTFVFAGWFDRSGADVARIAEAPVDVLFEANRAPVIEKRCLSME